jgi:pimeloyl-ACP methyl ester carboxylesterase
MIGAPRNWLQQLACHGAVLVSLSSAALTLDVNDSASSGKLYEVKRGKMYLQSEGEQAPTVVLVAGGESTRRSWREVEKRISGFTRVCSFDRLNVGESDRVAGLIGLAQAADDLHELLQAAQQVGPFIFVGHSIGGAICRLYADRYPVEVAAMLLLDPTPSSPIKVFPGMRGALQQIGFDADSVITELDKATRFPDVPLIVLSGDPAKENANAEEQRVWGTGIREYAKLSSKGRFAIVSGAGHSIQDDKPDVVISEIYTLVWQVRSETTN